MSNTNKHDNWYETLVGEKVTQDKYFHEGEDFESFTARVSGIFSQPSLQHDIAQAMYNADFFPAGRSLYGAGSKGKFKASMSNCYIMPMPDDNIEDIFDKAKEMARIFSYGGGTGINISNLRPRGAKVNNSAKTSTGAVSFMDILDSVGCVIGSNNRRAALIIGLNCDHPDIEEFLEIKKNNNKIQSANISILFTDKFMEAVVNNEMYELKFEVESTGEVVSKMINARDFFTSFAEANYDWGEPGCLFIDRIRKYNILSAYPENEYHIDISNPCVSGDTLILTRKGYVPIVELVGKEIEIWNGFEWSLVTPKVTGKNQSMKLVKLSNGMELKCTNYHKFVMKDNSRKKAEELVLGDKLAKWDYPVVPGRKSLSNAYTHGFYSGDGTKDLPQICLYGEKKGLLDYLDYVSFTNQEHTQDRISVIIEKGIYDKEFVPDVTHTVEARLDWLAGLIDSDGCLNDAGGSISISSIDKGFLKKVQLMLSTLGCHSSIGTMREAGSREMPDGNKGKKEYYCNKSYRLTISAYNVSDLVKLGLETHRVLLKANPNRDASRFIFVTEVIDLPVEPTVYCFNEPKNHTGVFNGVMTGQCAEYVGNAYNSCNLGSINLYNVVDNPFTPQAKINHEKLKELTRLGVIALDEILDYGYEMQPLPENKKCIDDWRAIGLGVFGLAEMFIALGVRYGSDESVKIVHNVMTIMMNQAYQTSSFLARDKGTFGKYNEEYVMKSPMLKMLSVDTINIIKQYGLRNASLLSIAPTGSIATMCGCSGGVEPLFAVSYERTTHALSEKEQFFKVHALSVEHLLKEKGIDPDTVSDEEIKEMFPFVITTHDIPSAERVRVQAAMQLYVDNAISSTVNLKNDATVDEVFDAYVYAWKLGCKGLTIFRDGCKRNPILVTNRNKDENKESTVAPVFDSVFPIKSDEIGEEVDGTKVIKHTACVKNMYNHVYAKDGNVVEVFTNVSQKGGCTSNINTITRLASLALRSGVKVEEVIKEMKATSCGACVKMKEQGRNDISNSCGHAIAEAIEKAYFKYNEKKKESDNGLLVCPECGKKTLKPEGRCFSCINCLYSKCE